SWVRPIEVEFALQLQRDGHQLQILPVVLKDQTVFRELSELNYVDFSKGRVSMAKLALTLANPEYDEIYNLRRELDKKSFNDRSLLSVLRRVATRARPSGTRLSWSSLSARKFMTEIEKVVKGRNFAEFVYWWLIVYGVLRFKDIDTW